MKRIIGLLMVSAALITVSCSNQPAEVKKEVIVVPPVIIKETIAVPPEKSTSVTLDKNGVKVETKKVNVTVKH